MASILLRNQLIDGAARKATPAGLPTVITVDVGGKSKDVPVAYFWKDAIATGEYQHPKTGQKLSIDGARLDGLVSKFHEMKAAGVEIPTPTDHSCNARDNIGYVVDAKREGDRLSLLHQVIGEKNVEVALANRCSLCIDPEYKDEFGRTWGDAIVHSAYTPTPVITGMGSFVPAFAASRDRQTETPVYYLSAGKDNDMDFIKRMRGLLGLADTVSDDDVFKAAEKLKGDKDTAETKVATLSRGPTPPTASELEALKDRRDLTIGRIDLSVKSGDMPVPIADKIKKALTDKSDTFFLSRNPAIDERPIDFVLSLFNGAKLNTETGDDSRVQLSNREIPGKTTTSAEDQAAMDDADAQIDAHYRNQGIEPPKREKAAAK
jgi:hypothetical protein